MVSLHLDCGCLGTTSRTCPRARPGGLAMSVIYL